MNTENSSKNIGDKFQRETKNYISFESVDKPGFFLRHRGFKIFLENYEKDTNKDQFKKDSTFEVIKGLKDEKGFSLKAINENLPSSDYYIVHYNWRIMLKSKSKEDFKGFDECATFIFEYLNL